MQNRKRAVYSLCLIWLALTGSYNAWQTPPLLSINGAIAGLILLWGGWSLAKNGPRPATGPLVAWWVWGVLISVLARDPASVVRIWYYAVLIACYHLPVDLEALWRGARWAGWVIFSLAIVWPWENGNSMAFVVWGLFWLGVRGWGWWALLAGAGLLTTGSEGGMLAMVAGGLVWAWLRWPECRRYLAGVALAGVALAGLVVWAKMDDPGSFGNRRALYDAAIRGILHSPIIGNGLNTFDYAVGVWPAIDPHNLIATIAWEGGLIGLALAGWAVIRISQAHEITPRAGGYLGAFIAHSMLDMPLYSSFFTAVTLFMILGGLPCREKITSAWPWPRRWGWPWPALQSPRRPR